MGTHEKLLAKILRGTSDANISFSALCQLLKRFGLAERIRGDHHIFTKDEIEEILNLQPRLKVQALSGETGSQPYTQVQAETRGKKWIVNMN